MGKRLLKCENFALIAVKPSEISEVVNIFGLSQAVLTEDLAFMHIAAKFVPQLLSDDQKSWRLEVCEELRRKVEWSHIS
jgi:hypothetical protein